MNTVVTNAVIVPMTSKSISYYELIAGTIISAIFILIIWFFKRSMNKQQEEINNVVSTLEMIKETINIMSKEFVEKWVRGLEHTINTKENELTKLIGENTKEISIVHTEIDNINQTIFTQKKFNRRKR